MRYRGNTHDSEKNSNGRTYACTCVSLTNAMYPNIPALRSPELPVLEDEVVNLVRMIDDNASYDAIFSQLCRSHSLVANAGSILDLETRTNRTLFHSMPRPLLRSLLMGTLAPHFYSKDARKANWQEYVYDDAYPGAYAACLHIHGRKGAFLSQRETRQLIEALKKYSTGVKAFEDSYRHGYIVMSRSKMEALEFTQVIDDELRTTAHWDPDDPHRIHNVERPRFAKTETVKIGAGASTANSNIEALIDMFESRCTVDESDQANPDLEVFQLQSPIMVGNTSCINARIINHLTNDYGSGGNTSKVFALTASCLKHMKLKVKSLVIPIFVAWEDEQIDPAEVLGTVLANSRTHRHGYNVKVPGTRGSREPSRNLKLAKEHVFAWKPFLKKNAEQSVLERREKAVAGRRAELANALANARKEMDEFKAVLEKRRIAKLELEEAQREWEEALAAAKAEDELMRTTISELREIGDRYDALSRFADGQ
ncbi:hypothetical protein F5Y01DRAFT_299396 [Xylaria sp. FL0043]|nr:hypothetical protein F5Y01DRAFT_299396 [Xylaria sp. FL0043]